MSKEKSVKYTVIFLLEKHNEDFLRYLNTIVKVFSGQQESFEIIVVAKGTGSFLRNLFERNPVSHDIIVFEMNGNSSQALCLKSLLKECSGEIIFVCGSYQHLTEESYGSLLNAVNDGADIITVRRENRVMTKGLKVQSYMFNTLVRWITGTSTHDLSCNVSAFRREVMEKTELYGNMYRYLSIYAARRGFTHQEVKCKQYRDHREPPEARAGFYNLSLYMNKIIDIFTLYFNTSFSKKPLRFFITLGMSFILAGFVVMALIVSQKYYQGFGIGNRPILLLSSLLIVIGIQSSSIGLLGEIIVFINGRKKKEFVIEKII